MGPVGKQLIDGEWGRRACLGAIQPNHINSCLAAPLCLCELAIFKRNTELNGPSISNITLRIHPISSLCHEGTTEEENNGYVVFKGNIPGNRMVERGGGVTPHTPLPLSTADKYIKTIRMVFPPSRIFASRGRDTLACGRGGGGIPIPTRGHTLWYSRYICTLWCSYKRRPDRVQRS